MRILHTSDWHLGRSFGQHRLLDDQVRFLDWLVDLVASEGVELVVVAGDLYDRSVPPAEAVEVLGEALRRICSAGAEVAAIAGNHDSAERVAAFDGLTESSGVVIRGGYRRADQVLVRDYRDGPLALVPTPYLDPLLAPSAPGEDQHRRRPTHESVLARVLDRARAQAGGQGRSIVVSHAFVTGARPCASERELAVGTAGMVSSALFDGFSYVALGHLHQPQVVAGQDRIRYSGSPLAYSFSETSPKEVTLVQMDRDGAVATSPIEVPVGRAVRTVRGTFQDLVSDPALDRGRDDWLRVELTDPVPVVDAHRRLRQRFPYLVEIARVGSRPAPGNALTPLEVHQRSPQQLSRDFWAEVTGSAPSPDVADLLALALTGPVEGAA